MKPMGLVLPLKSLNSMVSSPLRLRAQYFPHSPLTAFAERRCGRRTGRVGGHAQPLRNVLLAAELGLLQLTRLLAGDA